MNFFEVIILAIVEGLTEYLPISSTGHLILTSSFFGIQENAFVKNFNIIVQSGAILSVLFIYWRKLLNHKEYYPKILISFIPAAIIGLLVKDQIDAILGSVIVVAWALILGGLALIAFDYLQIKKHKTITDLSNKDAFFIGLLQCFAFIPGVSRSAASILAGQIRNLTPKEAAEYSFFLAVPTLLGATFIKLLKVYKTIEVSQLQYLGVGILVSFIVGYLAIRFFINIVSKYGFKYFGIYRIILGLIILLTHTS